jgi:hypothetical protein
MYSSDEEIPDSQNDPYDKKFLLDDSELRKFCTNKNLPFNLISLDELNNTANLQSIPINTFIHTGQKASVNNNGVLNHWLFLTGNYIFDSYGKYEDYRVPQNIKYIQTQPDQLQAYDSVICGMYCCLFYELIATEWTDENPESYGDLFVRRFNLTKNRKQNDTIMLNIFDSEVNFI